MNITEITDEASKFAFQLMPEKEMGIKLMVLHPGCFGYETDRPAREAMCSKAIELAKASPWIPVSERMPTREEADPSGAVTVTDGSFQWREQADRSTPWTNPTHWMPFVPPPQPSAEDKMRQEFEAWWKDSPHVMSNYANEGIKKVAEITWQAARKSQNA